MAFYAQDFIYNGIPSAFYGITISSEGSGEIATTGAGDIMPATQSIFRRPKPFFYGVQQTPVLTFPISFHTKYDLDAASESAISKWLFGQQNYKKLRIIQPDMQSIYYNCVITGQQFQRVGNLIRGYTYNVVCDSPWAWQDSDTQSYTYDSDSYFIDKYIEIYNHSDNMYYTYPTINFTTNKFGGYISITNYSEDTTRICRITSLDAGEIVSMDNDLEIMTSSTSTDEDNLKRLTYFNNIWVRMIPGLNVFRVRGNVSSVSFSYPLARKVA